MTLSKLIKTLSSLLKDSIDMYVIENVLTFHARYIEYTMSFNLIIYEKY